MQFRDRLGRHIGQIQLRGRPVVRHIVVLTLGYSRRKAPASYFVTEIRMRFRETSRASGQSVEAFAAEKLLSYLVFELDAVALVSGWIMHFTNSVAGTTVCVWRRPDCFGSSDGRPRAGVYAVVVAGVMEYLVTDGGIRVGAVTCWLGWRDYKSANAGCRAGNS